MWLDHFSVGLEKKKVCKDDTRLNEENKQLFFSGVTSKWFAVAFTYSMESILCYEEALFHREKNQK